MEPRYIALSIAFFIVTGCVGWLTYSSNLSNARDEYDRAERNLKSAREQYELLEKRNTKIEEDVAASAAHLKQLKTAEEASSIRSYQAERQALESEARDVIQQVRNRTVGLALPELKLQNGTTLTDVRVQKLDNKEILLSHKLGILRITPIEAPEPLASRFRINDPSFCGKDPMGKLPEIMKSSSDLGSVPQKPEPNASNQIIRELELQRNKLAAYIAGAQGVQTSWQQRANEFRAKAMAARGRANSYPAEATIAEQKVAEIQIQIDNANDQLEKIQQKLTDALIFR